MQDGGTFRDYDVIMADHDALPEDRTSSPESQPRGLRRARRWSGSKSIATSEQHELKSLSAAKRQQPKPDRYPRPSDFPSFWEETTVNAPTSVNDDRRAPGATSINSSHGQKLPLRRPWLPSHPAGEDDSTTRKDLKITLHDISQSMWIEDPDNHSTERVYLTIEAADLDEMLTIDPSFCWIHHERTSQNLQFEDFVRILDNSPGLYPHEHDVAKKVLEEVQNMGHGFGRGRYFEPMVHQVKEALEVSGQKTEVKATFISIPIFCAMRSQESGTDENEYGMFRKPLQRIFENIHRLVHEEKYSSHRHHHLASRKFRLHNDHPIRSLMQYANILAPDNSRDQKQAIIRLEDDIGSHQPFIHVPEFWALIINNYTIITCAPFTVNQLLGDNIKLRAPPPQDRRAMVKYTNLNGALHEFRCRTWVGLLDIISRIEKHVDQTEELSVLLQRGQSDYKLIDTNFCEMTREQWISLTAAKTETPDTVFLRLLKFPKDDILNVAYSKRRLALYRPLVFQLATLEVMVDRLQRELKSARRKNASAKELLKLEVSFSALKSEHGQMRRRWISHRFRLMAVRYHLIDPQGIMFDEDEVYQNKIRSRKPPKRTQSTLSSKVEVDRSQDPHAATPVLSGPVPDGNSSKVDNAGDESQPAVETEATLSPLSPSDGRRRRAEVAQQVIERLRTPLLRAAVSTPTIRSESSPQSRISSDTVVEEVNARFQPPRRSRTSQSLVPARGHSPSLQRSRTSGLAIDLEAQLTIGRSPRIVTFAPEPSDRLTIPTYTIPGSERQADENGHIQSVQSYQRKQPSIFRPQLTVGDEAIPGFLAITPQRLPPIQTLLPKQALSGKERSPDAMRRNDPVSSSTSRVRSRLAASRTEKDLKRLQPFFEWRAAATTPSTPRGSEVNTLTPEAQPENGYAIPGFMFDGDDSTSGHTLDILDMEMNNSYELSVDFPILPQHYLHVQEATIHEVIRELENQPNGLEQSSTSKDSSEAQRFWDTKLSILLNVDIIMSCFIGNNELPKSIVRKIWGIVLDVCRVPLEEIRKTSKFFPYAGHKPLAWGDRELSRIERMCREILLSARSDTGNRVEQMDLPLPPSFKSLFRDIVLFLLSISLAAHDSKAYAAAADKCRQAVELELRECETALLRTAREHKHHVDEEYMNESIKTADTLLGLLLQNAFSLSCSDRSSGDSGELSSLHCDIEQIYWRWTAICHERAIREASAEMYEEVRLLREELDIITAIYEDQKKVLQLRESPKAKLDTRINKRTQAFLDDMINHFTTLGRYAEEAETLTTNSIRVSNEDNSKAIIIFTTITVIFLPLNAVSSILGMNVVDVRTTTRGSSLFWQIAVPVTLVVLVLCLILVKMKFKFGLRRRCGKVLLRLFPKGWAREHMQRVVLPKYA